MEWKFKWNNRFWCITWLECWCSIKFLFRFLYFNFFIASIIEWWMSAWQCSVIMSQLSWVAIYIFFFDLENAVKFYRIQNIWESWPEQCCNRSFFLYAVTKKKGFCNCYEVQLLVMVTLQLHSGSSVINKNNLNKRQSEVNGVFIAKHM